MNPGRLLVLVPTELEWRTLRPLLPNDWQVQVCGFGPIAAAIETTAVLARRAPSDIHVVLAGIGGTFDAAQLPPGSAASFRNVYLTGVGAWQGDRLMTPREPGIPQWTLARGLAVYEHLPLVPLNNGVVCDAVLTATTASGSREEATSRRRMFPDCLCEEMEGFGVALAATRMNVPVSIARGVSNEVGNRDHGEWQIDAALESVARLLRENVSA